MSTTVFYGAGQNAISNLHIWLEKGIVPVCFADNDSRKWGKSISPAYPLENQQDISFPILPLDEVIDKYPDYELYITIKNESLQHISQWLHNRGIPGERIRYLEPVEWRKGCSYIGTRIEFLKDSLSCCCVTGRPSLPYGGNMEDTIERYKAMCCKLNDDLRQGIPTTCDGCVKLVEGFFPKEPQLVELSLPTEFYDVTCNFRCSYCAPLEAAQKKGKSITEFIQGMQSLQGRYHIMCSAGEICVSAYRHELLRLIKEKQWMATFVTNASVYNEDIAELLQAGRAYIFTSMDAGTPETFARIKGVDCYDKVVQNLKQYASAGASSRVLLKYIFLEGVNDNKKDVLGFLELAMIFRGLTSLSCDIKQQQRRMNPQTLQMLLHLYDACVGENVPVIITGEFFHPDDYEIIHAAMIKQTQKVAH